MGDPEDEDLHYCPRAFPAPCVNADGLQSLWHKGILTRSQKPMRDQAQQHTGEGRRVVTQVFVWNDLM